jgi:hypothetical protein
MTTPPPPPGIGEPTEAPTPPAASSPGGTAPAPAQAQAQAQAQAELVYLVAGGDMVAVFDNDEAADIMTTTMIGANLDPMTRCVSASQWDAIRAELLSEAPELTITDARPARTDGAR